MIYIMYMTPTQKEAIRIARMAKRLHGVPLPPCVMLSPVPEDDPIYREPQYGKPRVRVHWQIGTRNPELASDDHAWQQAIELYETRPYWIAFLQSLWDGYLTRRVKGSKR